MLLRPIGQARQQHLQCSRYRVSSIHRWYEAARDGAAFFCPLRDVLKVRAFRWSLTLGK